VTIKSSTRLNRLYDRLGRDYPAFAGFLGWARSPKARLVRIPLGLLLVCGGIFSILPILGIWMLPLGLLLLAVDFPPLQTPVAWVIIKGQRWWELRKRRKRDAQSAVAE
jgi:hypothetical protein